MKCLTNSDARFVSRDSILSLGPRPTVVALDELILQPSKFQFNAEATCYYLDQVDADEFADCVDSVVEELAIPHDVETETDSPSRCIEAVAAPCALAEELAVPHDVDSVAPSTCIDVEHAEQIEDVMDISGITYSEATPHGFWNHCELVWAELMCSQIIPKNIGPIPEDDEVDNDINDHGVQEHFSDASVVTSVSDDTDYSADTSAVASADTSADAPAFTSAEDSYFTDHVAPTDAKADAPAFACTYASADTSADASTNASANASADIRADSPANARADNLADTSASVPADTCADAPAYTSADSVCQGFCDGVRLHFHVWFDNHVSGEFRCGELLRYEFIEDFSAHLRGACLRVHSRAHQFFAP
jgi:hypothetical protein